MPRNHRAVLEAHHKTKIAWLLAHQVKVYCETHNIKYTHESTVPNTISAGAKRNRRTSNGMLYHVTREQEPRLMQYYSYINRVYLCWQGEPLDQVIEGLAFLKMTQPKRSVYLVRCRTIIKPPEEQHVE